ncbi:hypothetical protein ABEB36_010185 [Hypothenemus hampei]|uniref:Uncharacterized protein n=1 Tax=Hypothenemus hampei TaxID=57062 RepID=A0ABD1EIU3_HYPHA
MSSRKTTTLLIFLLIKSIQTSDEYVKELRKECLRTRRPYFCVTSKIAKFLEDFELERPVGGTIKLVKISPQRGVAGLLPDSRFLSSDTQWEKIVKFLRRKLANFVSSHGIAFELPDGVSVVQSRGFKEKDEPVENKLNDVTTDEGRGHKLKDKKIFILSVIIMAKLVKIIIIVNLIFFALLFIKKIILLTAIVFPSVLSHIKEACQKHHAKIHAEEIPSHSPSWFGWRQDGVENPYWSS